MKVVTCSNKNLVPFQLSDEAVQWLVDRDFNSITDGTDLDIKVAIKYFPLRHHPLLIECIETLGHKANTEDCWLRIEKISSPYYRIEIDANEYEEIICLNDFTWIDGTVSTLTTFDVKSK